MQIRVRGPNGQSTIVIDDTATVAELISTIAEKTGLPTFDLKSGFPPRPLDLNKFDALDLLCDIGVKLHGEQITAIAKENESASAEASRESTSAATGASKANQQTSSGVKSAERAPSQPRGPSTVSKDPPQVPFPSRSATMVLRVMPDDNSCLFRAIGTAVFGNDLDTVTELRSIVAQAIQNAPEQYTAAVLDQEPDAYCEWIQMPDSWGGGIEMSILSQHFGVEICSVDVRTQNVTRFNENHNLSRIILVYSNIHYDTIALSPSEPPHKISYNPPEFDVKQFDADDDEVVQLAREMCKELAKQNYYFDAVSSGYGCKQCGWKGSYKEMSEHVKTTGHTDMTQV